MRDATLVTSSKVRTIVLSAKKTPLRVKQNSAHFVVGVVTNSLCRWSMEMMANREMCRICDVILGTKSEKRRPCDPRHK